MKLLRNQVLLKPFRQPRASSGGVLFPQQYQDDQTRFRVVAVGPGKRTKKGVLVAPEVAPGDFVIAPLYLTHITLPNGLKIADADQLLLKWTYG